MTNNYFLKSLEKDAWKINFKDGLMDLYFASLLLGNALAATVDILFGMTYSGTISFIVLVTIGTLILLMGKRWVTIPRIGKITIGPIRLKKIIIMTSIIGLAVLSTFALWIIPNLFGEASESLPIIPIYFFIFIGVIFGSIAYMLDYNRGYIISIIAALSWGLNEFFIFYSDSRTPGAIAFAVGGTLVLIMGVIVLSKFVKEYPKMADIDPEEVRKGAY